MSGDIPTTTYTPVPGSRLEQLCARYDDLKAKRDAAAEKFDEVTDGIKAEIATLAGADNPRVDIETSVLARPLRYSTYAQIGIDSKKLKAERPEVYALYSTNKTVRRLGVVPV